MTARAALREPPRLMNREQMMAYLGVSSSTLARWIADGHIPGPVVGSRFDRRAVDAALDRASGLTSDAAAATGEAALIERARAWVE